MPLGISERVTSAQGIVEKARQAASESGPVDVAVAAAADEAALEAVAQAAALGICRPALFGSAGKIRDLAPQAGLDLSGVEIEDLPDESQAAKAAVKAASEGRAGVIMKGFIGTSALLKTVLSKEFGLRGKGTISHTAVLDVPGIGRLTGITDGGVVVKPDADNVRSMIANSRLVFNALGIERPMVALSAASDIQQRPLPGSLWRKVLEMHREGAFGGVDVCGPFTIETASMRQAAELRGITGTGAGAADVILVSSIEECNVVSKALIIFAGAVFAGIITGAKVPVSLVSRTDSARNKLCSLALACLVSRFSRTRGDDHAL